MSSSSVITPEDVLESLMNDGTIDALRLEIINQLKANVFSPAKPNFSFRFQIPTSRDFNNFSFLNEFSVFSQFIPFVHITQRRRQVKLQQKFYSIHSFPSLFIYCCFISLEYYY